MPDNLTGLQNTPAIPVVEAGKEISSQETIRLLLTLWQLGKPVDGQIMLRKSELTAKIKRKRNGKRFGNCQAIYTALQAVGAIEIRKFPDRIYYVILTEKGLEILGKELRDPAFSFEGNVVPGRLANSLLDWLRQLYEEIDRLRQGAGGVGVPAPAPQPVDQPIQSYQEFEQVALEVYHRLNQDYNLDHLVPIYRMRRQIGERVSRSQFNEWLLQIQANKILQLIGGELTDISLDKIEDSVKTPLGSIRYYAQLVSV